MHRIFLIDNSVITYNELISLINGESDMEYLSEFELTLVNKVKHLTGSGILNFNDLIEKIKNSHITITLETSGTTGLPKVINHTIQSITKNIKVSDDRGNDVWGFTYNPNKMAGYQVLFQAILNGNTLVNLFKYQFDEISNRIKKYNITHISATPTFYKLLTSESTDYLNVKHISLGGEGSNLETHKKLQKKFPNAKIKNIYASTEVSSLLASDGEYFKISEYNKELIKVDNGKLKVHKNLVGNSDDITFDGNWYDTGDLIEMVDDTKFKIVGREGNLINIGGYQVNPIYIENKINEIEYVKLSNVYSKSNSILGNILVCDVVLFVSKTVADIKKDIRTLLNDYEIPTKINIVDEIKINENGKISRK
jgi:acyl-coenzyme A synthetase/AMP-(fatty) acid ligase